MVYNDIQTQPKKTQHNEYGERPVTFFTRMVRMSCGIPLDASKITPKTPRIVCDIINVTFYIERKEICL
jgi:hypothetical protein